MRAITWGSQENGTPTLLLLPPPFVRNLYTQRGLFIDTSANNGFLTSSITMEVTFPKETNAGRFEVIRKGKCLEIWPDVDESEKELINWAREIAVQAIDDDAVRELVRKSKNGNFFPKYWLEKKLYDVDCYSEGWLSIFDWVIPATCVTAMPALPGDQHPMRYEILGAKVKALARANPSFFDAFIHASADVKFSGYFEVIKNVLALAKKELNKLGYSYSEL